MIFQGRIYSDIDVVQAFSSATSSGRDGVNPVCQFWYNKCKNVFGKGTSNYGSLSDYLKEDLFQESFILLWSKIDSNQLFVKDGVLLYKGKEKLSEVYDLSGFFMRIVRNKFLEFLREKSIITTLDDSTLRTMESETEDMYWDENPEIEQMNLITSAIMKLPRSCQDILTAIFFEHKSLAQLFEQRAQNDSYMGLKTRKSKCMNNLRNKVREWQERRRR